MLPFTLKKLVYYAYKKGMMRMFGCIFCQIGAGEKPARLLYQDDLCIAFQDINPQAPVHFLVVPRQHLASLNDYKAGDETLLGHLLRVAALVAREQKIDATGFRTVINTNAEAGQTVFHLHLHIFGGREMQWPPWPNR
jgi:histidine triad (HIT) family protein